MNWTVNNSINAVSGVSFDEALRTRYSPRHVLALLSPSMVKLGVKERLSGAFPAARMYWHEERINNPDIRQIENIAEAVAGLEIELIVAIGGGSIVDTAKVLAALLCEENGEILRELREAKPTKIRRAIPVCAIPTTAGSGAECTQFATVWDLAEKKKYSLESPKILPEYVILDAALTLSLPQEQTLFTGMDALSHAVECLWNKSQNPLAIAYAKEAIDLISENLECVLKEPKNIAARAKMQSAAFLAGQAISITKTAIAHAISYPLTYRYGVPHGLACSFSIPAIFELLEECENPLKASSLEQIRSAAKLIEKLELGAYLQRYLAEDQLMAMTAEMNNPQRFTNFILKLEAGDLERILSRSI
jgi:alcohol dehydrogenase